MKLFRHIFSALLLLPFLLHADEIDDLRARAQKGDAEAQFQMAEHLTAWTSDSQDSREAAMWYGKAAAQGHPGAMAGLGACYLDGYASGVEEKDYVLAKKYLTTSAEAGVAKGQLFLAGMYEKGEGVPQDYVLAYKWLNLAAAQDEPSDSGYTGNGAWRDKLAAKMSREQIAEGQRLSREFVPRSQSGLENLWRLVREHPALTALGLGALIYAMSILIGAARGKYREGGRLSKRGTAHVLAWTLIPPLWFFLEYYWCGYNEPQPGQEAAGKIWAGVLAALLFLVKRS